MREMSIIERQRSKERHYWIARRDIAEKEKRATRLSKLISIASMDGIRRMIRKGILVGGKLRSKK